MLTFLADDSRRDCEGHTRRDFLRVGTLGLTGWTLPALLATRARAAEEGSAVKDTSVVLLFLAGGPSHIGTFDPKMDAPSETRSVTGELPTTLPGVTFGGTFPELARLADRMAIVRSFQHRVTDHARAIRHVITAGNPTGAGMGSIYARLRGTNDRDTGIPTHGLVSTAEVDGQYLKEKKRIQVACGTGALDPAYGPFDPASGSQTLDDMKLNVPRPRFQSRWALLESLDRLQRRLEGSRAIAGLKGYEAQAFDVILRGAAGALDLSKEDPALVARYDTSGFRIGHKKHRDCTLGWQLLMARRLCELGCGFVTVQNAGWDMHADGNNPGMLAGMRMLGPALDRAVSAFLDDIGRRGLSHKILLVITGDFGRTPRINKRGGRDHWPALSTLALAGGGLRMGQVIGRSSRKADVPESEPVTPSHLLGTVLHVLFDLPKLRLRRGIPGNLAPVIEESELIRELV